MENFRENFEKLAETIIENRSNNKYGSFTDWNTGDFVLRNGKKINVISLCRNHLTSFNKEFPYLLDVSGDGLVFIKYTKKGEINEGCIDQDDIVDFIPFTQPKILTAKEVAEKLLEHPDFKVVVESHFLCDGEVVVNEDEHKFKLL
jgi:hypothetical protein